MKFSNEVLMKNRRRLVNQMWKLIPMKENGENWIAHLDTLIEEICGLGEIFSEELDFLILVSKLEGLKSKICENDFMLYRKSVFRCIDLLTRVMDSVKEE
jgi:hypothetical protein